MYVRACTADSSPKPMPSAAPTATPTPTPTPSFTPTPSVMPTPSCGVVDADAIFQIVVNGSAAYFANAVSTVHVSARAHATLASLLRIRLQPPSHTAAASITCGCSLRHIRSESQSRCSLHHIRLKPLSPMVTVERPPHAGLPQPAALQLLRRERPDGARRGQRGGARS